MPLHAVYLCMLCAHVSTRVLLACACCVADRCPWARVFRPHAPVRPPLPPTPLSCAHQVGEPAEAQVQGGLPDADPRHHPHRSLVAASKAALRRLFDLPEFEFHIGGTKESTNTFGNADVGLVQYAKFQNEARIEASIRGVAFVIVSDNVFSLTGEVRGRRMCPCTCVCVWVCACVWCKG